jgi:hypothetical protein
MNVDGKTVHLAPGMAATVEIKTGKKKLIEFLLSPLMRMTDGGKVGSERVSRLTESVRLMSNVETKVVAILASYISIDAMYVWVDTDYLAPAFENRQASAEGIGSILAAVGTLVPKAHWHAQYFFLHNSAELAAQLLRVYGFCLFTLSLALTSYWLFSWHRQPDPRGEPLSPERRRQLSNLERMNWAGIVLLFYMNFFGVGLLAHGGRLPFETITGENVIAFPVVGFPILFLAVYHAVLLRRFSKAHR